MIIDKIDESYLEKKIIEYQDALNKNNKPKADEIFNIIYNTCTPYKILPKWQKQYQYLYDTPEDFEQEYMLIFIKSLKNWKPRNERKESRYNGSGKFQNYFWGSLQHHFVNTVKCLEGSAKRNISTQCPECSDWTNPISTHIIKKHSNVLWAKMKKSNIDADSMTKCPFCSMNIYKKNKKDLTENQIIKQHILSKHLHLLFEAFGEKHKDFVHPTTKFVSSDIYSEENDEISSVYDLTPSIQTIFERLDVSTLSAIQQKIIDNIISKNIVELNYSFKNYNCSEEEFDNAISELKEKISIFS